MPTGSRTFATLKRLVEESDTRAGRAFDWAVRILIVFSLISFSIETLPDLSATARRLLHGIEILIVGCFTVEYLLRIVVADHKLRFVTSFFGVIDLLAILPFYLSLGVDLRSLRAVRLLRMFRVLKLVRYSRAIQRIHRALLIAREELVLYLSMTAILLYLASVGIYFFENRAQPQAFGSIFHCLWWAVATMTTVGYGDVYPITVGGKIFTFFVLMLGLGVVAVPAGLVASALSEARKFEDSEAPITVGQSDRTEVS